MKLRTRGPWMPAYASGKRLSRVDVRLLAGSIYVKLKFQTGVFGTEVTLNEDKSLNSLYLVNCSHPHFW